MKFSYILRYGHASGLRHYLKKDFRAPFLKYYTVRKPYISDKLWRELRQYIYNPVIFPGEDNGIIYIQTKDISVVSYALQGENSSGRGFSWGDNTSENGARKSFRGSVLKCPFNDLKHAGIIFPGEYNSTILK